RKNSDGSSNHAGIATKAFLPVVVTDHGQRSLARAFPVLGRKKPSNRGLHAEHGKIIFSYQVSADVFLSAALDAYLPAVQLRFNSAQAGQRGHMVAKLFVFGVTQEGTLVTRHPNGN